VVDAAMVGRIGLSHVHVLWKNGGRPFSGERGTNLLDSGAHFYDNHTKQRRKYISIGAIEPSSTPN
jgi:alpha-methylacyl-CoA racemase